MPSAWHDSATQLFKDNPGLAVEILRDCIGIPLPNSLPARIEPPNFNDRPSFDFNADTVVVAGSLHEPVQGIIIEAQQYRSNDKPGQFARYAIALWLYLKCPVEVLVICPDAKTANWYRQPVETSMRGYTFFPLVLHPEMVPAMKDWHEVAIDPALATLSVAFHGTDRAVIDAFVAGIKSLAPDDGLKYYEYGYSLSPLAVQQLLEELVTTAAWPAYSPFAKKHFGAGRAEGLVIGERRTILLVAESRGLPLDDVQQSLIANCEDLEQLQTWTKRAVTATTAREIFG